MTDVKRNTQRSIERTIRAAIACGLKVVAVRPDGTVLTQEAPPEASPIFDEVAADFGDEPKGIDR